MILARTLILGFPPLIVVLAWWAAEVSMTSHEQPKDGRVVMLAEEAPALDPFMPASEAERQICDLIHEPLLRIDEQGRLQPALTDVWRWSQRVTCWFADAAAAKRAQERLRELIDDGNRWAEWNLLAAETAENALLLNFDGTTATGAQHALAEIAELQPQPVVFWRIERETALTEDWHRLMSQTPLAGQVRRVWFDGPNACEIVLAGPSQRVLDELSSALNARGATPCEMRLLGQAGALVEPVLDLEMRPAQFWHDGAPVTAEDAKATLEFLNAKAAPLAVRDTLRHIQSLESQSDGARLKVTFRKRYGPSLATLANVPVLPAAWLRSHPQARRDDFRREAPPGAGGYRIAVRDSRSLVLVPVDGTKKQARLLFSFAASPLMAQIGIRTRTVDFIWPASAAEHTQVTQFRFTPPRQRLVVLWNTRHPILGNPRLREALALATDSRALIRDAPGSLGEADASIFAPGLWFSPAMARLPFDIGRARELLSDAGWPRDVHGMARSAEREFRFTLLAPAHDALHRRTAELLVDQWRELGAAVNLEFVTDSDALALRLRAHRFDAVLVDQRFDVSWDQLPWWHSSQADAGGTNFCGVTDPQVDLQLEALEAELDPDRVPARVRELESRLLPLHPLLPLFTTHDETATISGEPADRPPSGWTLRGLTSPDRRVSPPVINLQLRLPE